MKKFSVLALIVLATATFTACSKKDKGGNNYNPYGYAPNSCYNQGMNQFRYVNGTCVDSRTGQQTNPQYCQGSQLGYNQNPSCNFTGGYQLGNQFGYGMDACSQVYGYGWVTSRDMFGQLICVNANTWSYITNYYGTTPILYNGMYQTCTPGAYSNCNCRSFGGTLGWFQAGVQVGYCF